METLNLEITKKQNEKLEHLINVIGSKEKTFEIIENEFSNFLEKLNKKYSKKNVTIKDIRRVQERFKHLTISTESYLKEKLEEIELEERKFEKNK